VAPAVVAVGNGVAALHPATHKQPNPARHKTVFQMRFRGKPHHFLSNLESKYKLFKNLLKLHYGEPILPHGLPPSIGKDLPRFLRPKFLKTRFVKSEAVTPQEATV
jgi:hypothetical protein